MRRRTLSVADRGHALSSDPAHRHRRWYAFGRRRIRPTGHALLGGCAIKTDAIVKQGFFQWLRGYWARPAVGQLTRTFLTGLIAVLPITVTLALVLWLIGAAETFLGGFIQVILPNGAYRPGMGLLVSLLLIFGVGLMMQAVFFRQLVQWLEEQLERVPMIKTVYSAVRDLTGFLSKQSDQRKMDQVVLVQLPNLPIRMLGFVTLDDLSVLNVDSAEQCVAVYLPMSYQIGGYTVMLPRKYLSPVNMKMEDAMRFLITAGLSRMDEENQNK